MCLSQRQVLLPFDSHNSYIKHLIQRQVLFKTFFAINWMKKDGMYVRAHTISQVLGLSVVQSFGMKKRGQDALILSAPEYSDFRSYLACGLMLAPT